MATRTNITLKPAAGSSHEQELDALATVYKFVLDCRAKKEDAHPGVPKDAKERSSELRAKTILHQDP